MLKLKDASKSPKNLSGNMAKSTGAEVPSVAVGRDGGGPGKQISDKVEKMPVSKSSLTKSMP